MSSIIASPFGKGLPYPSMFFVPTKLVAVRRPPEHFWAKAIAPPTPAPAAPDPNALQQIATNSTQWLDDDTPALSESEEEGANPRFQPRPPPKRKSFARIRQIAYQAFVPKAGSNKTSTIVATEIVSKKKVSSKDPLAQSIQDSGLTIFNSWRIKTRGAKTQVEKLAAVVRKRVSSRSPEDQKPKTWEEYNRLYSAGQININDPPLPPTEPSADQPTPFQNKCYMPPNAEDEATRQLVINRLGVFGRNAFDSSDDAVADARKRTELAEKLELAGQAPQTLQQALERPSHEVAHLPETLEQHPVFRRIVRQCRETFGASISMLSIMDADRQIFLAESGLDGLREAPRVVTVCAHTVLSGRKGFTILDTLKDWRFSSSPLVVAYGARFYAGVPLMAPNMDGSLKSEQAACPIGTLCVLDIKPRDSFGVEERMKLVYMAEFARREIEAWFRSKVNHKMAALADSHQSFVREIQDIDGMKDEPMGQEVETLSIEPKPHQGTIRKLSTFGRSGSSLSLSSKSAPQVPGLFQGENIAIKPKMLKVFEMATKLVSDTLDLPLVYLLAVTPHGGPSNTGQTRVLSGCNLPSPLPSFDPGLHLGALRAPEGGLLYQNPSAQESLDAGLIPNVTGATIPYASAMLVRLGPQPAQDAGGFVIAGFSTDVKRVFGAEDFGYMQQFASELTRYTSKLTL